MRTPRARRGSALILTLVLTFGLAALVMSSIYLSAGAGVVGRLFERERDFRYAAEGGLALAKSRINRDTLLVLMDTGYNTILSNQALTDAQANTIPRVRVDVYAAFTGDTMGRFGQFATVVSRAYDAGGTRHVRRLDLTAESFSRYALFVNTWASSPVYTTGEFIRGRAHSNGNWNSTSGTPGPTYFDTVSAVGSINGNAVYSGITPVSGAPTIAYPTVAKLAVLPTYATAGNLNFTPVSGSAARATSGGGEVSGLTAGNAMRGTRLDFVTVDVDNDNLIDFEEGFVKVFDAASGIDTTRLRADLVGSPVSLTDIILQNQCGGLFTIGGRDEFFPVATFNQQWVRARALTSTNPTVSVADTNIMRNNSSAGVLRILSKARARCFPAGAPQLMLTERITDATNCNLTAPGAGTHYAWGASPGCLASQRYGGQDTTFTPTVRTCVVRTADLTGQCTGTSVALGTWRTAAVAIQLTSVPAAKRQSTERIYLHPLTKPYNLNSRGVIHFTAGPIYASGVNRGFTTLYVLGGVDFVDDLTYDADPAATGNTCRNFLGLIARDSIMLADNSMNRPRVIAAGAGGTLFLGPNRDFLLHAVTMSLLGVVGTEGFGLGPASSAAANGNSGSCPNNSGGCINQTGGVIHQRVPPTYSGTGTGLRENRSVDPCQLTNQKPPFFPITGRYVDNKYWEIDPVNADTPTDIRNLYNRLRGRTVP
ncbi:MAG: hypothetical protein K2X99_11255 [Gemmatimonadaceae bacterium]|nr:hypothetical protein [Gemmatimonadaceae bacterium]